MFLSREVGVDVILDSESSSIWVNTVTNIMVKSLPWAGCSYSVILQYCIDCSSYIASKMVPQDNYE